jgi:hypothetical protein
MATFRFLFEMDPKSRSRIRSGSKLSRALAVIMDMFVHNLGRIDMSFIDLWRFLVNYLQWIPNADPRSDPDLYWSITSDCCLVSLYKIWNGSYNYWRRCAHLNFSSKYQKIWPWPWKKNLRSSFKFRYKWHALGHFASYRSNFRSIWQLELKLFNKRHIWPCVWPWPWPSIEAGNETHIHYHTISNNIQWNPELTRAHIKKVYASEISEFIMENPI